MTEREAIVKVRYPEEITCLATPERVVGRKVLEWAPNCGDYGMGGPGFFGIRLGSSKNYPEEWLILTLWGADNWLEVNGRWLAAHPHQYETQRPLYSNFGIDQKWDDFASLVIGESLTKFEVGEREALLEIGKTVICLHEDPSTRPYYAGGRSRVLGQHENLQNAWIITQNPGIKV